MHFFLTALLSGSLATGVQATPNEGLNDLAFARRLSRVALTELKLERMAVAKESFAERQIEPLPDFPFVVNLDSQIKSMTTPNYATTLRVVGLTAREYVEGMQTVGLVCSGWVEKREIDLYFQRQVQACSAWPNLVKRILK